jgi:hypothetical protein
MRMQRSRFGPAMRHLLFGAAAAIAEALACSESPVTPGHRVPASLDLISGGEQTATVGIELPQPIVIRVADAEGGPVAGQLVNFRVTSGGGSVFAGSAITNDSGVAKERWTIGTIVADTQRLEARAVDPETGEGIVFGSAVAFALPGPVDKLVAGNSPLLSGLVGKPATDSLVVIASDTYGNAVPGAVVRWQVTPAATLSADSTNTSASGAASTRLTFGSSATTYTVTATSNGKSVLFAGTASPAAAASVVVVDGNSQSATVGDTLAQPVRIRVTDADGVPVPGVLVQFTVTSGGGVAMTDTARTPTDGYVATRWKLGTIAGVQTLKATVASLPPASVSATANPSSAANARKNAGDRQAGSPGSPAPVRPSVRVTDVYGNGVPGISVDFHVETGGGSSTGNSQTTDANGVATVGSWILGTSGTNAVIASVTGFSSLVFTANAIVTSPEINMTLPAPTPYSVTSDSLFIVASVVSTHTLTSVRASYGGKQTPLTYYTNNSLGGTNWRGTLDLAGERHDTLLVQVSATDVNGAVTEVLVLVIHDTPPVLTVSTPTAASVARPFVSVKADCVDDDPRGCKSIVVERGIAGQVIFSTTAQSIDQSLSLAPYNGQTFDLSIVATDWRGRTARVTRNVNVESSTRLVELRSAPGPMSDIRGDRVLYTQTSGDTLRLRVLHPSTAADSVIREWSPFIGVMGLVPANLTTGGAFWVEFTNGGGYHAYDWRAGVITDLGTLSMEPSYTVSISGGGEFGLFNGPLGLVRRDFAAGTQSVIATGVGTAFNSIAPNGDVVYWTTTKNLYRLRVGETSATQLTTIGANIFPLTDGTRTVFIQSLNGDKIATITDGSQVEVLSSSPSAAEPITSYDVANGWISFLNFDAFGVPQVWRRSPAGVVQALTASTGSKTLNSLEADGTIIFQGPSNQRYRLAPGGNAEVIGTRIGRVLIRDGQALVLLGRTAFTITP